jgi:hypothetical protein
MSETAQQITKVVVGSGAVAGIESTTGVDPALSCTIPSHITAFDDIRFLVGDISYSWENIGFAVSMVVSVIIITNTGFLIAKFAKRRLTNKDVVQ